MSLGDIKVLRASQFGEAPTERFTVAAGAAASIKAGEPVAKVLGSNYVSSLATNKPVVSTDFMAGIAQTTSTDSTTAVGTVDVLKLMPGVVYLIKANAPTSSDTQAEYDALVGKRVLFDKTNGLYTLLISDGATSGCTIEPLEVAKYPGMIAFSIRSAVSYFA